MQKMQERFRFAWFNSIWGAEMLKTAHQAGGLVGWWVGGKAELLTCGM
jgi:hypothetical protein